MSTFAFLRIEGFSLLSLFSLIRLLDWVLRVALNAVSAVVVGVMKEMMTRLAVLRIVYVCLEVTGTLAGECRMTLEAELLIEKGWVESLRTEAAKSSVDIDRPGVG